MKIIDLLNKIAKGEEVPKEIKYNKLKETEDNVYTYSKKEKDYIYLDEFAENEYFFEQIFNSTIMDLNDEIEIVEEKKFNIKKLEMETGDINDKTFLAFYISDNRDKINELIEEVNKLKGAKKCD